MGNMLFLDMLLKVWIRWIGLMRRSWIKMEDRCRISGLGMLRCLVSAGFSPIMILLSSTTCRPP